MYQMFLFVTNVTCVSRNNKSDNEFSSILFPVELEKTRL